ncbi:hypothetical protein DN748_03125 [Sinomicrobium soli]|nr:hypothetical protein DN748_03125 [Sinomicrobium sp. N-1-3-6]
MSLICRRDKIQPVFNYPAQMPEAINTASGIFYGVWKRKVVFVFSDVAVFLYFTGIQILLP